MANRGITLVLGGVGVKGAANIGVLKSIREHKIKVNRIVASGVSSLAAALFASDRNPELLTQMLVRFFTRHQQHLWAMIQLGGIRQTRSRPLLKSFSYFLRGTVFCKQNINEISVLSWDLVREDLQKTFGDINFDELKIPLYISAIDLNLDKEVLLAKGGLINSLGASIAFPGFFPPVPVNEHEMISSTLYCELPLANLKKSWHPIAVIDIPSVFYADPPHSAIEILAEIDQIRRAAIKEKLLSKANLIFPLDWLKRRWESYEQIPELVSLAYNNMNKLLDSPDFSAFNNAR